MFHHLVHRHHQKDDIDLSKQTHIRVNRLHLERHLISVANRQKYSGALPQCINAPLQGKILHVKCCCGTFAKVLNVENVPRNLNIITYHWIIISDAFMYKTHFTLAQYLTKHTLLLCISGCQQHLLCFTLN